MLRGFIFKTKKQIKVLSELGLPMRQKLFMFFLLMALSIIFGVFLILFATGVLSAGLDESKLVIRNELIHLTDDIVRQYGELSVEAVNLSKNVSFGIETDLSRLGMNTQMLKDHPEVLDRILNDEFTRCQLYLEKSRSSGVFIILDATVNPSLPDAQNSRAGIYIKNMEPNILSNVSPNYLLLRGGADIGRNNDIMLHPQWSMEFNIADASYFKLPMQNAQDSSLALSRLYYWSDPLSLTDVSEEVMFCSVPLIDSQGNVFGVCGLEISAMLFKLSNMPDNTLYNRIFCLMTRYENNIIDSERSFFAGSYNARSSTSGNYKLSVEDRQTSFSVFNQSEEVQYLGFWQQFNIYPQDSAYSDDIWIAAMMVPKSDIMVLAKKQQIKFIILFLILLFLGAVGALHLSRFYIKPIMEGINRIKSNEYDETEKIKIPEIDALIEHLSAHMDDLRPENSGLSSALIDEFIKNTQTLSQAERAVFNLYVQGYDYKEIADILCLSVNTIKTHNKHIYIKLNITSREELLLYISLLREAGKEIQ